MIHATRNDLSANQDPKRNSRPVVARLSACILAAVLFYGAPVSAADAESRQHAIQIALQQNGGTGKVLGVNTVQNQNGTTVFEVKVLTNGRVRVFRVDKAQ